MLSSTSPFPTHPLIRSIYIPLSTADVQMMSSRQSLWRITGLLLFRQGHIPVEALELPSRESSLLLNGLANAGQRAELLEGY